MRDVKQIDKQFVGAAPGLDDGKDRSVRIQLPLLGETLEAPVRGKGG